VNKTLIYTAYAARNFWDLPEAVQESLVAKLLAYGLSGQGDVKPMKGSPARRLRHGDYRVIFNESATSLTILAVGHRRDVYLRRMQ
jgi:mRNA interferase RelE/StbE